MLGAQQVLTASELANLCDDLRAVFCCEVMELLTRFDETLALAALDLTPQLVVEMCRLLHTIKGAAAAAGELEVRDIMHALEDRAQALSLADRSAADAILVALTEDLMRVREKIDAPADGTACRSARRRTPEVLIDALHGAVSEAAHECGKPARLIMHPDAVAAGPPLIMRLYEPLLHLVRNAVAHGIEPAVERRLRGKDPVGTVVVESNCDDGLGTLWVIDDGGGLDLSAVRRRAAQLGLPLPADGVDLSAEATLELLCQPGFSTREQADTLAGRGIGLFAVRCALRELGGTLSLHSVAGNGCIFTLEIPLK